ncbi:hypothetical protein HK405_008057 [Cladochytrium tenue]|nr:hypothetical protein HK405_008057 [Cladochytrium tenue]
MLATTSPTPPSRRRDVPAAPPAAGRLAASAGWYAVLDACGSSVAVYERRRGRRITVLRPDNLGLPASATILFAEPLVLRGGAAQLLVVARMDAAPSASSQVPPHAFGRTEGAQASHQQQQQQRPHSFVVVDPFSGGRRCRLASDRLRFDRHQLACVKVSEELDAGVHLLVVATANGPLAVFKIGRPDLENLDSTLWTVAELPIKHDWVPPKQVAIVKFCPGIAGPGALFGVATVAGLFTVCCLQDDTIRVMAPTGTLKEGTLLDMDVDLCGDDLYVFLSRVNQIGSSVAAVKTAAWSNSKWHSLPRAPLLAGRTDSVVQAIYPERRRLVCAVSGDQEVFYEFAYDFKALLPVQQREMGPLGKILDVACDAAGAQLLSATGAIRVASIAPAPAWPVPAATADLKPASRPFGRWSFGTRVVAEALQASRRLFGGRLFFDDLTRAAPVAAPVPKKVMDGRYPPSGPAQLDELLAGLSAGRTGDLRVLLYLLMDCGDAGATARARRVRGLLSADAVREVEGAYALDHGHDLAAFQNFSALDGPAVLTPETVLKAFVARGDTVSALRLFTLWRRRLGSAELGTDLLSAIAAEDICKALEYQRYDLAPLLRWPFRADEQRAILRLCRQHSSSSSSGSRPHYALFLSVFLALRGQRREAEAALEEHFGGGGPGAAAAAAKALVAEAVRWGADIWSELMAACLDCGDSMKVEVVDDYLKV